MALDLRRLDGWLEETHSTRFELCRHFFLRFFDSDLISTPGQWRVVAIGAFAIVISSSLIFVQAYWHKYLALDSLDTPGPYLRATVADAQLLVTLSMVIIGLFTTLLWSSLFPGLLDYLALASLPLRLRDVFITKFTALSGLAAIFIVATTLPPSLLLPTVSSGRYAVHTVLRIPAIFISCSLAALFVFCSLVAVQGVLLNLLSHRQFTRVSLAVQGALLTILLCGFPLVFALPSLDELISRRPELARLAPPAWFLGVHQVILGTRRPLEHLLAARGLQATKIAAAGAILTYLWTFRRHRVRLLESRATAPQAENRTWLTNVVARLMPDPRKLGVFAFVAKTLARSRHHRLVLTAFAAVAIAVIFESFISVLLGGNFGPSERSRALREAAVSAPLALSLFVLASFRYLFRLPVELASNWVFRVSEPGNRIAFLIAVEHFLLCCAVAPVALLTLPLEMVLLGPGPGIAAGILCLLVSLILMEMILVRFEKVPFTSSYLPGRQPLIQTLLAYGIAVGLYVWMLSSIVTWSLEEPRLLLGLFAALLAVWLKIRKDRREDLKIGKLEFEELPEPVVQTLRIERD